MVGFSMVFFLPLWGHPPLQDYGGKAWAPGSFGDARKGRPLTTAGHFGVIYRLLGDLDWMHNHFKCRLAAGANLPCCFDDGNRGDMPFLDLRPGAAWTTTLKTPPCPAPDHPVFTVPGASLFCVSIDEMHTVDLGVLQELAGSILWTLVYDNPTLEGNAEKKLDIVWGRIRALYEEQRTQTRMANLTLQMFCNPKAYSVQFPSLSAHAAETRALFPILAQICSDCNVARVQDVTRLKCAVLFMRLNTIMRGAGMFLSEETHKKVMETCWEALAAYMSLSQYYASKGFKVYNVVNKHHMLVHICLQSRHINPKVLTCYSYEDLVGRMQRVAMKCTTGLSLLKLSATLMTKYQLSLLNAWRRLLR